MIIGVIGLGMVGKQVKRWFDSKYTVLMYDIRYPYRLADMDKADVVFICISTPYRKDCSKGVDITPFMETIGFFDNPKTFVIKSTVPIGFTETLQKEYPEHTILHNPEFLSEKTAWNDFKRPSLAILGHTTGKRHHAIKIQEILPKSAKSWVVDSKVSELYKLMRNSYLALKVSYFNTVYDVCTNSGIDYLDIHRILKGDSWIGQNHTVVNHKGYRGFGGKCLPKDIRIFNKVHGSKMIKEAISYNDGLLKGGSNGIV